MTVLHFGVIEQAYVHEPVAGAARKGKKWRRSDIIGGEGATTGDVAEILEARYHIMEVFFEVHRDKIVEEVEKAYAGAMNSIANGQTNAGLNPLAGAAEEIQIMFSDFLSQKEMDNLSVNGYFGKYQVPTRAAQRGVSHRFAHPYARRPPRPSFIDTGTYQNSFRVWSD